MRRSFRLLPLFLVVLQFFIFGNSAFTNDMKALYFQYGLRSAEDLHASFKKHIKPLAEVKSIGYLEFPSKHRIDQASLLYTKKALRFFKKQQVAFVLFKISAEDGDFDSVSEIASILQKFDVNDAIPVMLFVDPKALGFSSLLLFACRYVFITNASQVGNIQSDDLIFLENKGVGSMNESISLASFYDRPTQIVKALLNPDCFLVKRGEKFLVLEDEEEIISTGDHPDVIFKGVKGPWAIPSEALIELGLADLTLASDSPFQSPLALKLLLNEPYLNAYQVLPKVHYQLGKGYFFMWITHPILNAFLLVIACLGLFYQFLMPKWSWLSVISGSILGVLLYAGYILDSLHWIEVLIFSMGFLLFVLEKTFIKGFSTLGILGCFLIIISLMSILLPGISQFSLFDFESFSMQGRSLIYRMIWLVSGVIVALLLAIVIRKQLIRRGLCTREADVKIQEGDFFSKYQEDKFPPLGSLGMTDSLLMPFGKVRIHGKIFDAVAVNHETIDKQSKIVVIKHKNGKLIVKHAASRETFEV